MTNLLFNILFWLDFQIYLVKSLKSICQAPVRLIGKRGLICDHRNFIFVQKNLDEFVYF